MRIFALRRTKVVALHGRFCVQKPWQVQISKETWLSYLFTRFQCKDRAFTPSGPGALPAL